MKLPLSALLIWKLFVIHNGVVSFSSTVKFATPSLSLLQQQQQQIQRTAPFVLAAAASSDDNDKKKAEPSSRNRKRVRRKRKETTATTPEEPAQLQQEEVAEEEEVEPVVQLELKPRESSKVQIQVADIRNAANGQTSNIIRNDAGSTPTAPTSSGVVSDINKARTPDTKKIPSPGPGADLGFDYNMLLRDAEMLEQKEQKMVSVEDVYSVDEIEEEGNFFSKLFFLGDKDEKKKKAVAVIKEEKEEESNLPSLGKIISIFVTADFFFVLLLLGWFVAGIAQSAVFNVQTVQIAFNNNFERIVQPALGILMIGSASSAIIKEDEE